MEQVKVEYYGHSCFKLTWKEVSIVLDPYEDGCVPGIPNLRLDADFVFCSHSHGDHNAVQNVKVKEGKPMEFSVTELETDHDDANGTKRGKNTIRIFDFNGIRIAHFGDLGRQLSEEEAEKLRALDCILVPVGGFFTIDGATAAAIAEDLKPRMVIPMHYRTEKTGFDVLADVDDVLPLFSNSQNVVVLTYGGYAILEHRCAEMKTDELAVYYHDRDCNCCQSVLCSLGKYTGIEEAEALAIAYGFGGGMACGNVCGAVTGSLMAIGKTCLYRKDISESRPIGKEMALEFEQQFIDKYGTLLCSELTEPEGRDICEEIIKNTAVLAEEYIKQHLKTND